MSDDPVAGPRVGSESPSDPTTAARVPEAPQPILPELPPAVEMAAALVARP